MESSSNVERVAAIIVDAAVKVHIALGPGLLESVYQKCYVHELRKRGLSVETEVALPIHYDGESVESGLRIDMLVEGSIVVENKSVEKLHPLHEAQLLTYLRLSGRRIGFLLNWNSVLIKDGIKRMVNGY
ncbi:MAG TPA: GxxExxY protein [Bacteroidetes bacterium]|nr:MAG: GxxExxY protein [Ignavibacteria bacterium GWC2_56_12]HAV22998.1 GxxExxY protein [Bacteroidota bacterium]